MEEYIEVPLPNKEKFTIYTKSGCIYCNKVKELLRNQNYVLIDCDSFLQKDKLTFLEIMEEIIGFSYKTFPMVFKNGAFIGGYQETNQLYQKIGFISY